MIWQDVGSEYKHHPNKIRQKYLQLSRVSVIRVLQERRFLAVQPQRLQSFRVAKWDLLSIKTKLNYQG